MLLLNLITSPVTFSTTFTLASFYCALTFLPITYFLSHHYLNKVVEKESLGLFSPHFLLIAEEGYFLWNRGRKITQEEMLAPLCGNLWAICEEEEPHVAHFSEVRGSVCTLGTFFLLFYATMKWNHTFWQDFILKGQEHSKIQAWTSSKATLLCWANDGQSVFRCVGVFCPAVPCPASQRGDKVYGAKTGADGAPWWGVQSIWVRAGVHWNDLLQKTAAAGQTHDKIPNLHGRWGITLQMSRRLFQSLIFSILDFESAWGKP